MRSLILDNYDSFTYNLFDYVQRFCTESDCVEVRRNDEISIDEALAFDNIILSPGPGLPSESGIMPELLSNPKSQMPILGICLGHQAIAESHGAALSKLKNPLHGYEGTTTIINPNNALLIGVDKTIKTGHYHSWVVSNMNFPKELSIDAIGENEEIMAITHQRLPRFGIQFHPESIMTSFGLTIILNWITFCRNHKKRQIIP